MAIEIKEDIIDGTSMLVDFDGCSVIRHFKVSGLPTGSASGAIYRAYNAVGSGGKLPRVGDGHPDIPEMFCRSVEVTNFLQSKQAFWVSARYQSLGAVTVRLNGNLVRETTRLDAAGNLLRVGYMPPTDGKAQNPRFTPDRTQGLWSVGEAEVLRPGDVLTYERAERNPSIGLDIKALEGATNDADWNGQPKFSWMNLGISASTTVLWGKVPFWIRSYSFGYKYFEAPNGTYQDHRVFTFFTDFHTGKIPLDVDPSVGIKAGDSKGNGWIRSDMQPIINYSVFNLPEVL
jgi:hypothetical protein